MTKSKPLVFFGTEDFSGASLRLLLDSGWKVGAIVTKPDKPAGRGRLLRTPAVKAIAAEHDIPVYQPAKAAEALNSLAGFRDLGVLVAYGKLIPEVVIRHFKYGIVNLHPSLLPRYRGPSPIEAAILNGDRQTGLSLMDLTAEMDAGPLYAQKIIKLNGDEDRLSLSAKLAAEGARLLADNLEAIITSEFAPYPQDDGQATYTKLLRKDDGFIDWSKPAARLEREVRAYLGFPRSRAKINGHEVIVTRARVAGSANDGALVKKTGQGWLEIRQLIAPSGRLVSGEEFLRGYSETLGKSLPEGSAPA